MENSSQKVILDLIFTNQLEKLGIVFELLLSPGKVKLLRKYLKYLG